MNKIPPTRTHLQNSFLIQSIIIFLLMLFQPTLSSAQWTRVSDALRKRAECPSVLYQGKIYVFGGFGEHPNFEKDNEVYDPVSNAWSLIAPFPAGKEISHQGFVLVDDKIWHIGGRAVDADGPVSSQVIIYNITNNTWSNGPELKDPATGQSLTLGGGGAALVGRTLHVFGGFSPTICVDQNKYHLTLDVDKWNSDPINTTWANKLPVMPFPRNHLSTVVLGGKIYALGGQFGHDCSGADQKYCHVYDPVANTWTRLTDLPSPRSHCEMATFPVDGKIFMIGGQGPSGVAQNTVYIFSPSDNNGLGSWTDAPQYQLPNVYYGISSKVIGNKFIISHGALTTVTNERIETYSAPIARNTPYQLGFTKQCFDKITGPTQKLVVKNILYTIEGQTQYNLTSNAAWLTISTNQTGLAIQSGVDVEAIIDPAGLADGNYSATITATGTGAAPAYTGTSFCVNLTVTSAGSILNVTVNGDGSVAKDPDQTTYYPTQVVTLTATPGTGQYFAGWSGDTTATDNPLLITMGTANKSVTANFAAGLISDITISSGRDYLLDEVGVGVRFYADRTYEITSVPAILNTATLLKISNDDKTNTSANFLSFNLNQNATLYVAYDPRATALPAWLSGWQKLPDQIGVNDSKISTMDLYSKDYFAGRITLGGNLASPASGAMTNYFVMAKATSPVQYSLNVNVNGNGTIDKDPDQSAYNSGTSVIITATPAIGQQFTGWSGDASGSTNPLVLSMNANKTITANFDPSSALITNVVANSGKNYNLTQLAVGVRAFIDRTYNITSVPNVITNATLIQPANDDKTNTTNPFLSFNLNSAATLYIAYDPRGTTLPAWLNGWQKIADKIGISDPNISNMDLYSKDYLPGTISLGGNLASPASGSMTNYFVMAKATSSVQYFLNVSVNGNGTVSKNPDQSTYNNGTSVTVTATPAIGQQFTGWSGDESGNTNPLTVSMNTDKTITANFSQSSALITNVMANSGKNYTVTQLAVDVRPYTDRTYTITAVPNLLINATMVQPANDDKTNTTDPFLSFNLNDTATLYIAYDPRGTTLPAWLNGWQKIADKIGVSDSKVSNMDLYSKDYLPGSIGLGGNLASPANGAMTNYFIIAKKLVTNPIQYSLNVNTNGGGTVTKSPDQSTYNSGMSVTTTATPELGQQFTGWSGDTSGTINPLTVTMTANKIITANFTPSSALVTNVIANSGKNYTLAQLAVGVRPYTDRTYTITSVPSLLNNATLVQPANDDKTNTSNPFLSFNLNDTATLYIAYDPRGATLPAWLNGWQKISDKVGVSDSKVANMDLYSKDFTPGRISLGGNLASPANGAMTNYFVIAKETVISPIQYSLQVTNVGNGTITKNPDQPTYTAGSSVSLTAVPESGYQFTGWTGDTSGTANPLNIIMDGNKNIFANFTDLPNSKSILFDHIADSVDIQQGESKSLLEYISTSDDVPVNAVLSALDENNNLPQWLSVNGQLLNGINYTTGSEISFDFDASTLSVGIYTAFVNASSTGYNSITLKITLTVKAGSTGTLTNLKINFQDSLTVPPQGWIRDYGQAFGQRLSAYQGGGNVYGWINKSDSTPLNLTKNSRNRNTPADITLATLMHMQAGDAPSASLTPIEGVWEVQVADGVYDVSVSAGDGSFTNSRHTLNVEGITAISNFVPTSSKKFDSATVSVSVADGLLTIDASGGLNTKINYVIIVPTTASRPSVVSVKPENGSQQVSENTSISTSILDLPNAGIDNSTITNNNVYLTETATGTLVPSNVNGTGGGDAITLVPAFKLKSNTTYTFNITNGVRDLTGATFIPYSSTFTTGQDSTGGLQNAKFDKINLPNTVGRHSSLTMGPDGKLYALTIDGMIKRFPVNNDGTLGTPDTLYSLQDAYGARQQRLAIGFAFDPSSTAGNLVAWVTHSTFTFLNGPSWDGKLTRLSGDNLQNVQDILINLPRSVKDHLTNSIAFGPNGKLYFTQGSTSAMGRADNTWGNRNECLLSAAVLRLDVSKLGNLPLDVKTSDGGGTYNPYDPNASLTIYASGVRNAYDLVWHSNGNLYVPTNGSAAGGNTPASFGGTIRSDGSAYDGPAIPQLSNVQQTQKDFLFRIVQGGYYGHPNPLRGEYVMNGGNPTTSIDSAQVNDYPVGTLPDANWRRYAFDFQNNKSPNGVIEYKSNTFDGALKGKLLVVRYSQNDDIVTLTPGGPNNDIVSSAVGTNIEGFSGFVDPLDLTEDTLTGNIYVSEYGGNGKIVLLRPNVQIPTTLLHSDSPVDSVILSEDTGDSGIISEVNIKDLKNNFERPKVYPNPFHNKFLVQFPQKYSGTYSMKIADLAGRVYEVGNIVLNIGGSNILVDISKLSLKKGVYFLRVGSRDGRTTVIKLLAE